VTASILCSLAWYAVVDPYRGELRTVVYDFMNERTNFFLISSADLASYIESHRVTLRSEAARPHSSAPGPLRVHSKNPRYFGDGSGQIVYLTGSHTWLNLQDGGPLDDPPPMFAYERFLDFLEAHHHNFFRLWTWEQAKWVVEWRSPYYFRPLPYERTGPGLALDGKPRFDLTSFDKEYFDRLRRRVVEARDRGFYVAIMLFNGWSPVYAKGSYDLANPWEGHPFHARNNVNGIDGDPNDDGSGGETHTLAIPEVTRLQEAYVRQVVDTVNDLDNVLFEISNESNGDSEAWQYHMVNVVKLYEAGKPKQHPVGMTVEWPNGDNNELFASQADWISPNNYSDPPPSDGRKVIIADTDHIWGIGGNREWVWKSFTRGLNPIFMDQYDDGFKLDGGGYRPDNPNDVSLRQSMGYTRWFAERMNLEAMTPLASLASSGYCLANPGPIEAEYLAYLPEGGSVSVDLTQTSEKLQVEWFNPATGEVKKANAAVGGRHLTFAAPFRGDAVLYLTGR